MVRMSAQIVLLGEPFEWRKLPAVRAIGLTCKGSLEPFLFAGDAAQLPSIGRHYEVRGKLTKLGDEENVLVVLSLRDVQRLD